MGCFEDDQESGYIALRRTSIGETKSSAARQYFIHVIRIALAIGILLCGIRIGMHYPYWMSVYTRRPLRDISLLPSALPPRPLSLEPPLPNLPRPKEPIPNIVHYVYGLDTANEEDFPYYAYLGMRSALKSLRPERILFHCLREPRGYWWNQVKRWEGWVDGEGQKRGMVEVVQCRDPTTVGSRKHPIKKFAHKADILRLEILQQYGGIYIDIDTFLLQSFADHGLLMQDTVLGTEARIMHLLDGPNSDEEMNPKGLCNAIIVSRKDSEFLKMWADTYEYFEDREWADHSVKMPWTLAQYYPTTVTVLSERAFFWPTWTADHIANIYTQNEYDFDASGQLAYHMWESEAKPYLIDLNPETVLSRNTSFTNMAKRFMAEDEKELWLRHLQAERKVFAFEWDM